MSNEADNPATEAPGLPWDVQDAPARRATLTRILVRIAREALQGDDLESLLQGICNCLVVELPVPIASIILLDEPATHFVREVWAGELMLDPQPIATGWPVTRGASGRCARLGTPQLILDVDDDPDYIAGHPEVRSEYLVPIRHRQRLHGVLNIECTRPEFLDAEACAVFDAVADVVAGAIHFARIADELTEANHKLERLSMSDGLTGIANRRRFDRQLEADWARLARERRPLALLIVDADAFKPLNDALGHLRGDECLRELAHLCGRFAGDGDLVARFGGEELVLLLPGCELARACAIAESLRLAVADAAMPHPASPVAPHVTVSIGVSACVPQANVPPEWLVATADRAMYAAKQGGRNQVRAADEGVAASAAGLSQEPPREAAAPRR
ncbi:diguanylate cyclase [Pseudoluteimonas lycopersici]|uniref:diguanylate cyclase n=1 Tax=Pseudoluteimonas lycopersici TaxID=1324796 RepID=A0A516V5N8_9GAMM|nr:diguanylate cyclase [Lysobacter lycopersici]QDQ73838.1 diguanylate cyclase [Lysobacter lycopersici]